MIGNFRLDISKEFILIALLYAFQIDFTPVQNILFPVNSFGEI